DGGECGLPSGRVLWACVDDHDGCGCSGGGGVGDGEGCGSCGCGWGDGGECGDVLVGGWCVEFGDCDGFQVEVYPFEELEACGVVGVAEPVFDGDCGGERVPSLAFGLGEGRAR